jgi:hypothetical protein
MMKPLLIALAILLAIPNFISKDINEPAVFDQKERYDPALASFNLLICSKNMLTKKLPKKILSLVPANIPHC